MYKTEQQLKFEDFVFPYGKLNEDNRWVKLSKIIPWDEIEIKYAKKFKKKGNPAKNVRIDLGSLIIQQTLNCSDRELVNQVSENPYLQFFIGLKEFQEKAPFSASVLVDFRKRFSSKFLSEINELIIESGSKDNLNYCKSKGIRLSGPNLGRPRKDNVYDKKIEYINLCDRNEVEGKFGEGKRKYGLNRILTKLKETSECVINIEFIVSNLNKRLRSLIKVMLNFILKLIFDENYNYKKYRVC